MPDSYSLPPRRARIVRAAAALFVLAGVASLALTVATMIRPGLDIRCGSTGCADRTTLIEHIPAEDRPAVEASPTTRTRFAAHVARPAVRAGLAGVELIDGLPFAALMLTVSVGLRRLAARRGGDLASALPWFRRASIAALAMVVARPLARSLEAMILYPGTPVGPMWYAEVEFVRLGFDLLLALAAMAVAWALEAGSRAERDVAAFV